IDDVYSGDAPQLFGIGWIVDYPDPQDWLSLQFLPNSSVNVQNINDPTANDLMTKADVEQNPQTRLQEYNQAEQIMVNDVGWIITNHQISLCLFHTSNVPSSPQ